MSNSRRLFVTATALCSSALLFGSAASDESKPGVDGVTEADIGFCRDMTAHHMQALDMCQRVLGRDTGDAVQAAAAEVLQNQSMEVGQMRAWLSDWGASTVPPSEVMAWMLCTNSEQGTALENMPGYASSQQLLELSTFTGLNRGRRWLELMRAHHEGGVLMAGEATALASSEKVIRLAKSQVKTQSYEIYQYDLLLAGLYS